MAKITDPKEWQRIRAQYFDGVSVSEKSNEELMEEQSRRETKNQAR